MTLRCITESEGNENALSEMMVRAVSHAIRPHKDGGIELIEAFDQIPLLDVFEQMRALEYFYVSEAPSALERILEAQAAPHPAFTAAATEQGRTPRADQSGEGGSKADQACGCAEDNREKTRAWSNARRAAGRHFA
ncbi:hypothetical protein [Bradyrhizobium cenepequi]|uniref:hypothetical protein n=1 Tax=Bradyrhizobium cenepequi TaxID=2821403 RepID=UPI001CE389D1|nr:hypothetical protein [Bradyrhizobium cenepequi]MCA6109297.1 hypothetical protein [Bradyrhizobium cenepequi]